MKQTKTDRNVASNSSEYLWDISESVESHRYIWPVLENILRQQAPFQVLDLGCGNGALTKRIKQHVAHVVGMDSSSTGIKIAADKYPDIEFECRDIASEISPEYLGKFDMVVAVEVVEHLLLPRQLIQRAREALKPGGYLLVTTPYHGYLKNLALALVNKYDTHWHPLRDYGHVKFFSKKTLSTLIEEQGFEITNFIRVGRIPQFARSMVIGSVMNAR